MYLSIDPGATTGWCMFDNVGGINWMNSIKHDLVIEWLETLQGVELVIIEEFMLNPPGFRNQVPKHDKMITVQVIGYVKSWAKRNKVKVVEQQRDKRMVGYKYWGQKPLPKSDPLNHAYDATAHGIYYLQRKGIREPQL
jgi:hypothetical protein